MVRVLFFFFFSTSLSYLSTKGARGNRCFDNVLAITSLARTLRLKLNACCVKGLLSGFLSQIENE